MKSSCDHQPDEIRWLDFLEGRLPPGEARPFEEHVAICPECQAFCRQWRQLDSQLELALPQPSLSAGFAGRLRARIEHLPVTAQERRQLEKDFAADWSRRRRAFLRADLPELLDGLGYGVLAALGGWFLLRFLVTTLLQSPAQSAQPLAALGPQVGLGAGALLLLGTLWYAGRNQFARLLREL